MRTNTEHRGGKGAPLPQFDITKALAKRPLERILLTHETLHHSITAVGWAVLLGMVWPRFFAPFRLKVRNIPLAVPRLHRSFQGYRIAFLSDLHIGKTKQSYVMETLEHLVRAQPDLVVIGGDIIDYHPRSIPRLRQWLDGVRACVHNERLAPDGIYTIFGNHDYYEYSWRHIGPRTARRTIHRRLIKTLGESPVKLLRNESVVIEHPKRHGEQTNGGTQTGVLQIVGMDEMWSECFDAEKAFAKIDTKYPTICLQHNPDGFELLQDKPWDVMLCGHSHGGQVDVPVLGPIYIPMIHREYLRGFYDFPALAGSGARDNKRKMFVSTGIGYSKPLRFRVPPEIVIFTLQADGV